MSVVVGLARARRNSAAMQTQMSVIVTKRIIMRVRSEIYERKRDNPKY